MVLIDDSAYNARDAATAFVKDRQIVLPRNAVPKVVAIEVDDDRAELTLSFLVGLDGETTDSVFRGLNRDQFTIESRGAVNRSLPCCICGTGTRDAFDYVDIEVTSRSRPGFQRFGAHAACLEGVMAPQFEIVLHIRAD